MTLIMNSGQRKKVQNQAAQYVECEISTITAAGATRATDTDKKHILRARNERTNGNEQRMQQKTAKTENQI